jgi:hypothetical protein
VVPHTHWDREWYLSFEGFRAKLVPTLDAVLDLLATDPLWRHFHLDGQTAMIDDYLEVRPEREDEIRTHVASGRLSCGPWVTLVDEFLVSGESIVRNLEDGIERARELGADGFAGYLPDQFGHIGQMPQILRRAGIDNAVVWRGVPSGIDRTSFIWRAPDGSEVTALYLPFGYGQGRDAGRLTADLGALLRTEERRMEPYLGPGETMLLPAGDDHLPPPPGLGAAVEATEGAAIVSLRDHLAELPATALMWSGELRSAARANLLPNTYSVRPQQKVDRARAEQKLERYAEPLNALVPGVPWPEKRLRRAWRLLHLNGAHDSVCGCSTDEVAAAVDGRSLLVQEIADELAASAIDALAARVEGDGPLSFNPSPFERDGVPGLGWARTSPPLPQPIDLDVVGGSVVYGDVRLRIEDRSDLGDLYNFCPPGPPCLVAATGAGGAAVFEDERFTAVVVAEARPGDGFLTLEIEIDNRAPDHRVRLLLDLPEEATTTSAGAPFELVQRPPLGEGGPGETASPWWPARGFVLAGGSGLLTEGVIEYELAEPRVLACTLMRCAGTISRPHRLETRAEPAGPDVATPAAQLPGVSNFRVAVVTEPPGAAIYETWERFALPLLETSGPGSGDLPARGTLLDVDVPVLSAIRRIGDRVRVDAFNPFGEPRNARTGHERSVIAPGQIATRSLSVT